MDPPRLGEANHLSSDALQPRKIKVLGSVKREDGRPVNFSLGGTQIPSVTEKPVRSIGKIFDCTLKDAASIKAANQELEGWLVATDKSGLPAKFKAWIYQHGILGYCGHCWYMNFHSPLWKGLRGGLSTISEGGCDCPIEASPQSTGGISGNQPCRFEQHSNNPLWQPKRQGEAGTSP